MNQAADPPEVVESAVEADSSVSAPPTLREFDRVPEVPDDVAEAAAAGELVVFVGAGISRLIGCPNWDEFAGSVLKQLVPTCINYYDLAQINTIKDPKKRLSIAKIVAKRRSFQVDYASILKGRPHSADVYSHLNKFRCAFVTTNYDKHLVPSANAARVEDGWRFYRRDQLLGANIDISGNVVHLHGCINDAAGMVVTTKDYLEHYSSYEVQEFLRYLFERKTVLFLGYGLEEIEVLEYILRKGGVDSDAASTRVKRYILLGFFNADMGLFDLLQDYYLESFSAKIIPFAKDHSNYDQQIEILEWWSRKLQFGGTTLVDEVMALEDEIDG